MVRRLRRDPNVGRVGRLFPAASRYGMIATTIRDFLGRRADGMRRLALPDHLDRKLASLSEKAHALAYLRSRR
jgi:hypothetical protein